MSFKGPRKVLRGYLGERSMELIKLSRVTSENFLKGE